MAKSKKAGEGREEFPENIEFPASTLSDLLKVVSVASKASRVIFPSIPYVQISTRGSQVIFEAFNENAGIRYFHELPIGLPSKSVSVAAHDLRGLAEKMSGTVFLDLSRDGVLGIRSAGARYDLRTLSPDETAEFPYTDAGDSENAITFTAHDLRRALRIATLASGGEKDLEYSKCMLIHRVPAKEDRPSEVRFVTTDGFRLSLYLLEKVVEADEAQQILLDADGVKDLLRILPDDDSSVELVPGERHTLFSLPAVQVFVSNMMINYPDYEVILGREIPHTFSAPKAALQQAFSRADVLAENQQKPNAALMEFKTGLALISVESEIGGTGEEEISGTLSGQPLKIGLNTQYVLEFLSVADGDTVIFHYKDNASVCMMETPGKPVARYFLMPVRHPKAEPEE